MRVPGFLSAKVSIWQVVGLNVLTLVLVSVIVAGAAVAGAAGLDAFRPSGNIRIANSYSTTTKLVEGSDGPTSVINVQFDVPSGKVADIQVTYQGAIMHAADTTVGLCFGELRLDSPSGSLLQPGQQLLLDGGVETGGGGLHAVATSLQGRRNSVSSGSHVIYFVAETGGVGCYYQDRSLFVIANIRNS